MTIETKNAKNGTKMYYVDGKRTSRDNAIEAATENRVNPFTIEYVAYDNKIGGIADKVITTENLKISVVPETHKYDMLFGVYVKGERITFTCGYKTDDEAVRAAKKAINNRVDAIVEAYITGEDGVKIADGMVCVISNGAFPDEYAISEAAMNVAVEAEEAQAANAEREETLSTPLVTEEAMEEACYGEVMNAYNAEINSKKEAFYQAITEALLMRFTLEEFEKAMLDNAVTPAAMEIAVEAEENAANNLPTGVITVDNGTEAWAIVGKYFPNGIKFNHSARGYNREDSFRYTNDEIIYVVATCTPDNSRVECVEVLNTNESGSARHILTVYINREDETATEDTELDSNEEIINCTDEYTISDAAYRQMIDAEINNAARAAGNYVLTINGERVIFENHKIVSIDARSKFGLNMRVVNGRKQFRRYNYVIARATVAKFYMNSELAAVQEKKFREFFIKDGAAKKGFFAVKVYVTFDDGREHIYANYFDRWDEAKAYVETVKEFVGNVQCEIYIQRDEQCGKMYYHRDAQGTETYDLPDTDFFKGTPAAEIQARIDELKKAKADNEQYKDNSDGYVWTELCVANAAIDKTIEYYEFILHENKDFCAAFYAKSHGGKSISAMFETRETDGTEYKYYIKSRRPIYGAAPSGYIKAVSGEVHEPVRRPNGTYSPKCRIYFATVIYDKPLTDEQILKYDLAISNETFEKLNAKEEPIIANISVKETDGSEEDDDTNEAFNLLHSLDELNDVAEIDPWLIDDPAEYTDRNDRYNRGEKIAADLTAKLRPFDPTVEVTFDIDDDEDEDVFYLQYDGIFPARFTATGIEPSFHAMKKYDTEMIASPAIKPVDDFAAELAQLKAEQTAAQEAVEAG